MDYTTNKKKLTITISCVDEDDFNRTITGLMELD